MRCIVKIDVVIANPPYDNKSDGLCQKIDMALKKNRIESLDNYTPNIPYNNI